MVKITSSLVNNLPLSLCVCVCVYQEFKMISSITLISTDSHITLLVVTKVITFHVCKVCLLDCASLYIAKKKYQIQYIHLHVSRNISQLPNFLAPIDAEPHMVFSSLSL